MRTAFWGFTEYVDLVSVGAPMCVATPLAAAGDAAAPARGAVRCARCEPLLLAHAATRKAVEHKAAATVAKSRSGMMEAEFESWTEDICAMSPLMVAID